MRKFHFAASTKIRISGVPYRFVTNITHQDEPGWQLVRLSDNVLENQTTTELRRLYDAGLLVLDLHQIEDGDTEHRAICGASREVLLSDLGPAKRKRVEFRRMVIEQVAARTAPGTKWAKIKTGDGKDSTLLAMVLADISREHGRDRPVSVPTFYRWCALYNKRGSSIDLLGKFAECGNHNQLHPSVRRAAVHLFALAIDAMRTRNKLGATPKFRMRDIVTALADQQPALRALHPNAKIQMPSTSTLYKIWNQFPAFDRAVAKFGPTKARAMFRSVRGSQDAPEAALDCCEFDETKLPFFFIDEDIGVPLGRATLAWFADTFSASMPGFYIGFEPPGDLVIAAALRHTCSLKSYVKETYPNIRHAYLAGGIPRRFRFDNSLAQHANSIREIASNLDVSIEFLPPRTPWLKPAVEGLFEVLNRTLLEAMPGFVLPGIDRYDYDPTRNACIGLRQFLWIFHTWYCDLYAVSPVGDFRETPNDRWLTGTAVWEPEILANADDLDLIFGIVREATVDHRGVVFQCIRYYDEALHEFRLRNGDRGRIRIRLNPSDLEFIRVWDKRLGIWIKVRANENWASYAKGLSLHRHTLNLKHGRRTWGRNDREALVQAEADLRRLIAQALPMSLSIRTNTLIARAIGIGTDHLFGNLSPDGRLGSPSGPWEGQRLNPFLPVPGQPTPRVVVNEGWTAVPSTGGQTAGRKAPRFTRGNREDVPSADRWDDIPVYNADRSLGRQ